MLTAHRPDRSTKAPQPLHSRKTKALPPGKAPANRSQNDRPTPAPLPLSEREQQVCEYLAQGTTFEAIARHLSCSPAAARAYHRRALSKRQRTIASAAPKPALAEPPHGRVASALRSRPSPLELLLPSLFVTGELVPSDRSLLKRQLPTHPTIAAAASALAVAPDVRVWAIAWLLRAERWLGFGVLVKGDRAKSKSPPNIEFSDLACCIVLPH
jgi:DNA-binding CsgD family transcriptional regulator